ncbi:MAG TPA: hypothetical protein VFN67_04185 [Polyangiales bacterium]|jgi:hypothetical protein|nr:hypothetical protein [Polyangiales bacterium]
MWIHTASLNLRHISVIAALSFLGMSACGGSEEEEQSGDTAIEKAKVLTANKAGKACAEDKDCGTGSCKKTLTTGGTILGGATTQPAPGGYCSFACKLSADCGEGGVCIGANSTGGFGFGNAGGMMNTAGGQCLARCDSSAQCREGYRCLDTNGRAMESGNATAAPNATGACNVAPMTDTLTAGVVGAECAANEDCGGGQCMTTSQTGNFPGGYCTGRCLANSDCGEGAECAAGFGGGAGTCYRTCEADADCGREGYRCRPNAFAINGAKRCMPGAAPLADNIVGKACTADADCGGAAMSCVLMNGNVPLPDGYCSGLCVESVDCGANATCIGSFGGAASGYCYKNCTGAADCRTGYECQDLSFGVAAMGMMGAAPTVCAPPLMTDGADAGTP